MFMPGISGIIPGVNSVAVGAPDGTDPYWENTVLLLSGDGPNGSFSFIDQSFANHGAGTVVDGSSVETANKVFGTGSIRFDAGLNDQIRWDDHADWDLGASDFTIEMWVRLSNVGIASALITQYSTVSDQRAWIFQFNGHAGPKTLQFQATASGSVGATAIVSGSWSPTLNDWYYVCAERSGNTFRLYTGQAGGTATMLASASNTIDIFDSSATMRVNGTSNTANCMNGNIDELRFTKGVARYASDSGYPVPSAAFPRS